MRRMVVGWSLLSMLCALSGQALAVPDTMHFTGRISDSDGPIDGTVNLQFDLLDSASGAGTLLWTETHVGLVADQGLVTVELGAQTGNGLDSQVFGGDDVWLEIKVNGAPQSPRVHIGVVPYAVLAGSAETLGGLTADELQQRVSGTCPAGSAIRSIDVAGGVVCDVPVVLPSPRQIALKRWGPMAVASDSTPIPNQPVSMAFDGDNIWIAQRNGSSVAKVRVSDGAVLATYALASGPIKVLYDGTSVWVSCDWGDKLARVRASDGTVTLFDISSPSALGFDGFSLFVGSGSNLLRVNRGTGEVQNTYDMGHILADLLFDGSDLWASIASTNTVIKINSNTGTVVGTCAVGSGPSSLTFDGTSIWVANQLGGDVTRLDAASGAVQGTYVDPAWRGAGGELFSLRSDDKKGFCRSAGTRQK